MAAVAPHRLLIDTHVLLWMLTDPARLSRRMRRPLADRGVDVVVSAASAWEIATKGRLGLLPQAEVLIGGYERHLTRLGVDCLDITTAHSLLAAGLEWEHADPFDRVIAAQCMVEALPLVSADPVFAGLAGVRVLW